MDLNLTPIPTYTQPELHFGMPRDWPCLIQRIGVWSGFMVLWAGIATPAQAERVVHEHYENPQTFGAPYGVRTLSKMEPMYNVRGTGNPSSWSGPIWGIANYLTFRGFVSSPRKTNQIHAPPPGRISYPGPQSHANAIIAIGPPILFT